MSSERSIPHLRDIFGLSGYTSHSQNNNYNNGNNVIDHSYPNVHHQQQQQPHQLQQTPTEVAKKQSRKKRDNSKTLTSGDVKTLERHLSMKKTIRKKIMRDLQQAFVDDPNEFKIENSNSEHMKSELNAEALRFGEHATSKKSDNFLVMLRGDQKNCNSSYDYNNSSHNAQSREYDYDSPTVQQKDEKQSFWKRFTTKNKTKR